MPSFTYLQPVLTVLILVLVWGIAKRRRRLSAVAAAGIMVWCWLPVGVLASASLEWPYWQLARAGWSSAGTDAPEAIVVLSASVRRPVPPEPRFVPSYSKYVRLQHAAWLYHNWRRLPVLVSGGPDGQAVMADVMKTVLEGAGVPASDIWVERRSQSTYQNAVYSAELLKQKGIRRVVLVTEAYHMRRAEASFRKAGLEVSPAPCNFRSVGFQWELGDLLFQARAADYNDEALHEWIGLVSYWLQGRANLFSF